MLASWIVFERHVYCSSAQLFYVRIVYVVTGSTPDSSAQPSEVPSREISVEPKKPKIEEEKVADSWDDLIVDEKPQEVPDDWEQESEERYEKLENESEKVTAPNEERNATAEVKKTSTDVREVPRVEVSIISAGGGGVGM